MNFKKLIACAAIALGCGSMWAQTDVTSTYLTNADFEGEYTKDHELQSGNNLRAIYVPTGWTLVQSNENTNDFTALKSGDLQYDGNFASGKVSQPSNGGSQTLWTRLRWGGQVWKSTGTEGSPTSIEYQQAVTLPNGFYRLSADMFCYSAGTEENNHAYLGIKNGKQVEAPFNRNKTSGTWTNKSFDFYAPGNSEATIYVQTLQNWCYELITGFDNIKLEQITPTLENPYDFTDFVGKVQDSWTGATESGNVTGSDGASITRISRYNEQHYTGVVMSQVISGLPNGEYIVEYYANANCASWNCSPIEGADGATDRTVFYANDASAGVPILNDGKGLPDGKMTLREVLTATVTDGTLTLKLVNEKEGANWISVQIKSLKYIGSGLDLTAWNNAKSEAETALGQYDEKYAANERKTITDLTGTAPTNAAEMVQKINTLAEAVSAYTKKASNEKLMDDKSELTTFINTTLPDTYPNSSNEVLNTDISKWTTSTYSKYTANEHWNGQNNQVYYEQSHSNPDMWMQNSWNISAEQTINLPVGKYAFVVTARSSAGVTSKMTVNGTEVILSNVGNVGYGIATDGEATYDMSKTYANTTGRGWEYAYVEFEVTEAKDVTFKLESSANAAHNWVSIANPVLYYNDAAKTAMENVRKNAILATITETLGTVPASEVMNGDVLSTLNTKKIAAQNATTSNTVDELNTINSELVDAISAANTSIDNYTAAKNYMDGIQTSVNTLDEAGKESYAANEAYTSVKTAYDNRTLESLSDEQKTAMKAALVTAVKAQTSENAVFTLALNNPSFEEGTGGWENPRNTTGTYDYKTVTNGPADGIKALNAWANQVNYINVWQKQTLPAGTYTLSAKARTNAEPLENKTQVRTYINGVNASNSDGLTYTADETAWNDASKWITLTTTFSILEETEVEMGIYSTGKNVSGNQQGWFQVDDFQLVRNGDAPTTYARSTATNKYGTICLPYAASVEGATIYSAEYDAAKSAVVLSEVTEDMVAGTPYIYKATADAQTFTYSGAPVANPVAADPLEGTFTSIQAPVGSYVLQTQNGVQKFYIVAEDNQPNTGVYKAYLKLPASTTSEIKAVSIATEEETAIKAIDALVNGDAKIYDLNGRQLNSLQKGVNIVNGIKVYVK